MKLNDNYVPVVELKVEKLENQIETIVDMVEENKNLRNKVEHLKHLRRMDLEFLGILVWGYGLDKHKYDAMDKRIYSGYSTYKQHTYDWDWLMNFVNEDETDALFDRIELINNEISRDKQDQRKKDLELYNKREEERKEKEEKEKIVLTLTPEIVAEHIAKSKKDREKLNETRKD